MDPRDLLDLNLDLTRATGQQLDTQRRALAAIFEDPRATDDLTALAGRVDEVLAAIESHETAVQARDAARARLGAARVTVGAPSRESRGGVGTLERDDDEPEQEPVVTGARIARAFAPAVRDYRGGRVGVHVDGALHQRAAFDTSDYPSQKVRVPGILQPARDTPLTLLELVDRQPIGAQTIQWVQETAAPSQATEVAEGSAKPEATWSVDVQETTVRTIATWLDITRQTLEDESQLEGYITGRLSRSLFKRVNAQILSGNGTPPNIRGILSTSGIGTYTTPTGEDPLITIRKARTVAELSEYTPDAVVMNPVDWERIELSTDDNGQFRVVSQPAVGAPARIWGLVVVISTNLAGTTGLTSGGGQFLVGGFREGATFWERSGIDVYVTDSDEDKFKKNILTLLVEMRGALTVWRPLAFVEGNFDDGV